MNNEEIKIARKTMLGKIIFARDSFKKTSLDKRMYLEEIDKLQNQQLSTIPLHQLLDLDNIKQFEHNGKTKKILLEIMLAEEAHMMLLVLYLVELVGNKPSQKHSLYNDPNVSRSKKWLEFYKIYEEDINKLRGLRNNLYAHFYLEKSESQEPVKDRFWKFVNDAINLLKDICEFPELEEYIERVDHIGRWKR